MTVDVTTEIEINCPRAQAAAYACDPDNATAWYRNIQAVQWRSPPPLAVGSQLEFVAQFLGRRLTYTYEVVEHAPGERFVMQGAQGPFPMQTTYTWQDGPAGGTQMSLRNSGEPASCGKLAAPAMAAAMRRANANDLRLLKQILERHGH